MKRYKALAFDLAGTVFDWKGSVKRAVETVAANQRAAVDVERFAMTWRKHMLLAMLESRSASLPHMNTHALLPLALKRIAPQFQQLEIDDAVTEQLLAGWYGMRAWDDFAPALARMKDILPTYALSTLDFSMIADCSRASGICWDGVISCELLDSYKPEPSAYLEACALMGCRADEVCLVSGHHIDLVAARSVGMGTAYIFPHLSEPDMPAFNLPELPSGDEYNYCASSFDELADMLGFDLEDRADVA